MVARTPVYGRTSDSLNVICVVRLVLACLLACLARFYLHNAAVYCVCVCVVLVEMIYYRAHPVSIAKPTELYMARANANIHRSTEITLQLLINVCFTFERIKNMIWIVNFDNDKRNFRSWMALRCRTFCFLSLARSLIHSLVTTGVTYVFSVLRAHTHTHTDTKTEHVIKFIPSRKSLDGTF